MGKKKSTEIINGSSSFATNNKFCSLQDEIIQHLPCLSQLKGIIIGFSAVLRGIRTQSLNVVVFVARKATPSMRRVLDMKCSRGNVLLLQLQDAILISDIRPSTVYGIKASVLSQDVKFLDLFEKINHAKSCRKRKKTENLSEEIPASEKKISLNANEDDRRTFLQCYIHPKHCASRNVGKTESFISLDNYTDSKNDFPDYVGDHSEFLIHIK